MTKYLLMSMLVLTSAFAGAAPRAAKIDRNSTTTVDKSAKDAKDAKQDTVDKKDTTAAGAMSVGTDGTKTTARAKSAPAVTGLGSLDALRSTYAANKSRINPDSIGFLTSMMDKSVAETIKDIKDVPTKKGLEGAAIAIKAVLDARLANIKKAEKISGDEVVNEAINNLRNASPPVFSDAIKNDKEMTNEKLIDMLMKCLTGRA